MSKKTENEAKQPQTATIAFLTQYIKDLSFEAPGMPEIVAEFAKEPPAINVNVDINAKKMSDDNYAIGLRFKIEAKSKTKTAFVCELEYGSLVKVQVPAEHLEPVLLIEVPRQMFPFARSIIANITREGGFPPLMLNPIDFVALYQQRQTQKGNA